MNWILDNIGTIIIFLIILFVVGMIIFRLKKNKAAGKSSCGCGCSNCAMNEHCHSPK